MIEAISARRSIRRYLEKDVPAALAEAVVRAGMLAPSSKNRQPWRFVAVKGVSKAAALKAMERGLERERAAPLLPGSRMHLAGAAETLRVMRQAPLVLFAVNTLGLPLDRPLTAEERICELCNAQSVGAAMENMSLAAPAQKAFGSGAGMAAVTESTRETPQE